MPVKIKILLLAMLAGTGLIVFSAFANIRGISNLGANINKILNTEENNSPINGDNEVKTNQEVSCSDIDKDSLCDNEEAVYGTDPINKDTDGDGFLDGEEVMAGCSPLIPSPNDCSEDLTSAGQINKLNLTEYFSFLITGTFPFEKLNQPDSGSEFEKSVEILSEEASRIKTILLSVDDPSVKIETSKDASAAASQDYLNRFGKITEEYLSENDKRLDTKNLDSLYSELSKLKPPPNLADFHKKTLGFFLKLRVYVTNLEEEKHDPVKTLLTLENTDKLLGDFEEIRTEARAIHSGPFGAVVPVNDESLNGLLHDIHDLDSQVREFGRQSLHNLSNIIIDTIKLMGRQGEIADAGSNFFVQNFRNLSLEGQYRGENLWRGLLAVASEGEPELDIPPFLCEYIRESRAFRNLLPTKVSGTNILESGIRRSVSSTDDYLVQTKCDTSVDENFDLFRQDFSAGGGWEMWEKLLQPQNNIFGTLELALNERNKQIEIERQADLDEINSGSGYLGLKQCLSFGPSGQCVVWGPSAIPSDLAVAVTNTVLNRNLAYLSEISRRDFNTIAAEDLAVNSYILNLVKNIFGIEEFPF